MIWGKSKSRIIKGCHIAVLHTYAVYTVVNFKMLVWFLLFVYRLLGCTYRLYISLFVYRLFVWFVQDNLYTVHKKLSSTAIEFLFVYIWTCQTQKPLQSRRNLHTCKIPIFTVFIVCVNSPMFIIIIIMPLYVCVLRVSCYCWPCWQRLQ